jgi:peptidoglycan hydrolase CwlO-like protein
VFGEEDRLQDELSAMRLQRNELRGTVARLESELAAAQGEIETLQALVTKTDQDWQKVYIRQVEAAPEA